MGHFTVQVACRSVEPYMLAALSRGLHLPLEDIRQAIAAFNEELSDPNLRLYATAHVVYGRKPSAP
jgi:hypothetical protein